MGLKALLTRKDLPEDARRTIAEALAADGASAPSDGLCEDDFRCLVQAVPDVLYCIDDQGRFLFVNEAIRDLGAIHRR